MADTAVQRSLADIAEHVARGLVSVEVVQGRAYLRTPLVLPSGSSLAVVIEETGPGLFRVSDFGQSFEDAEMAGRLMVYRPIAQAMAGAAGMRIEDDVFVLEGLTEDQLSGASMAVAQAALRAAERSLE